MPQQGAKPKRTRRRHFSTNRAGGDAGKQTQAVIATLRRAFAANFVPALALWILALALLALYFYFPPARAALNQMAALKTRLGWGFSMPAQALAAGLLPFLFQRFQRGDHRRITWAQLPFLLLVRAVMGAMTDEFYTFQAHLFGDSNAPAIILLKTAFDMLVYTPLIVLPLVVWTFGLMDNGYALDTTRAALGPGWKTQRVLPLYFAALVVWLPTLAVLYALPLELQFPFQAIVQCFWGLVLVILTDK